MLVIFFLLLGTICVYYFWKSKVRLPHTHTKTHACIYYLWKSERMHIPTQRDKENTFYTTVCSSGSQSACTYQHRGIVYSYG